MNTNEYFTVNENIYAKLADIKSVKIQFDGIHEHFNENFC